MSANDAILNLTNAVQQHTNTTQTFLDNADTRIIAKENQVTSFLQQATPEKRFVQKITIGGSADYLYPVFWRYPRNDFGVGKLEISRNYGWNGSVGERPLDSSLEHQAALLLQLEGNGYPWSGDANYQRVLKVSQSFNNTASHLQFGGFAHREPVDPSKLVDVGAEGFNYLFSGIYLRGGGLDYLLSSNWVFEPIRLPDENDANSKHILHTSLNTHFVINRLSFNDLIEPTEDE